MQSFVVNVENPLPTPQAVAIYENPRGGHATATYIIDGVLVQSHQVPPFSRYKVRQYVVPAHGFVRVTVATMPDYTVVSRMAVGGGQIVVVGTTLPIGTSTTYAASLYTVSTSGGTPVVVDTLPVDADASAAASTGLALSGDAAYYSLGAGLKKVALDGSNSVTAVTTATTAIAGVGANPSASGVVYVVGQCVYAGE